MTRPNAWIIAAGSTLSLASAAAASNPIVVEGMQAPSLPAGITIAELGPPAMTPLDGVLFNAVISGADVTTANNDILYLYHNGACEVIYREGDPIASLSDEYTLNPIVTSWNVGPNGELVAAAAIPGPRRTTLASAIVQSNHGTPLVVRRAATDALPGYPSGTIMRDATIWSLSADGRLAFTAFAFDDSGTYLGGDAWVESTAGVSPIVSLGDPDPARPTDSAVESVLPVSLLPDGVLFGTLFQDPTGATNKWMTVRITDSTGTREIVRLQGAFPGIPADEYIAQMRGTSAGVGGTFSLVFDMLDPTLGGRVVSYCGGDGWLHRVAAERMEVPYAPGAYFQRPYTPALFTSSGGWAQIVGDVPVPSTFAYSSQRLLLNELSSSLRATSIEGQGDIAPWLGSAARFVSLTTPTSVGLGGDKQDFCFNDSEQMLINASVHELNEDRHTQGIWARDVSGGLHLIAFERDEVDIDPDGDAIELREAFSFAFQTGAPSTNRGLAALNNSGNFTYLAQTWNGSEGVDAIYTATVPDPLNCIPDLHSDGTNPGDVGYGQPDGLVTVADLTYFVEQWLAPNAAVADLTTDGTNPGDALYGVADGSVTTADLTYYVEQWITGCP